MSFNSLVIFLLVQNAFQKKKNNNNIGIGLTVFKLSYLYFLIGRKTKGQF